MRRCSYIIGTGCPVRLWMPLPGRFWGQAGWSCEQPGLEGGAPAYRRGIRTRGP